MQRVGFLIKVKPDKIEEYKRLHENVWPDLLAELKAAGIRNYSLWLRPDGLEFGYLECDDWQAACDYLAQSEVHERWQQFMQNYLDSPTDATQGGQPVEMLEMSFLLE
ncbi:MAG TPA: L-rhamnose mutarotase [Chthonomonadales bacterium]|nr:L-rhamnose mutarotase [Chthonomonadales bacterium]